MNNEIYHVYVSWRDEACHTEVLLTSSLDENKANQYVEDLKAGKEELPEYVSNDLSRVSIYVQAGTLI